MGINLAIPRTRICGKHLAELDTLDGERIERANRRGVISHASRIPMNVVRDQLSRSLDILPQHKLIEENKSTIMEEIHYGKFSE